MGKIILVYKSGLWHEIWRGSENRVSAVWAELDTDAHQYQLWDLEEGLEFLKNQSKKKAEESITDSSDLQVQYTPKLMRDREKPIVVNWNIH